MSITAQHAGRAGRDRRCRRPHRDARHRPHPRRRAARAPARALRHLGRRQRALPQLRLRRHPDPPRPGPVASRSLICVLGNLWWFVIGWIATSGPASGTPSVMIMRAMFGVRGNALFGSGLGVLIGLFYIVLNIAFTTLASEALLASVGIILPAGLSIVVLVVVSALSLVVSVFGHATIEKLSTYLSIAVGACFAAVAVFVFAAADWSYTPETLPAGDHVAMLLLGLTVVASGPLSWGTSADYSRYLPSATPRRSVVLFTALGGFVPSVLIAGPRRDRGDRDRHDRPADGDRRDPARLAVPDLPARDHRGHPGQQRAVLVLDRPVRPGVRAPHPPIGLGRHRRGRGRGARRLPAVRRTPLPRHPELRDRDRRRRDGTRSSRSTRSTSCCAAAATTASR